MPGLFAQELRIKIHTSWSGLGGSRNTISAVHRLEKDGTRTLLADRYDGKRFSGPNDLVMKSDGALYFTDSIWGLRGIDNDPARELPFNGFYLVKDGKVTWLGSDKDAPGTHPNGITLSPDEK